MNRIQQKPLRILVLSTMAFLVALTLSCAGKPKGPRFEALAGPGQDSALVYLYRDDRVKGIGPARLQFDDEKIGKLKNGEYTALIVYPGQHTLRSALMWLGLFARSWHQMDFEVEGGQTRYIRLSASTQSLGSGPAAAAAPGRSHEKAAVVLTMGPVDRSTGSQQISTPRRAEN